MLFGRGRVLLKGDVDTSSAFRRGATWARVAWAQHLAAQVISVTCGAAVPEHNRGRLFLAVLMQARCMAALDVRGVPSTRLDEHVVVTRSAVLLRENVLPRYSIACAASSAAPRAGCALFLRAVSELCRVHGRSLNVALVGDESTHSYAALARRACPGVEVHSLDVGMLGRGDGQPHQRRRAHLVFLEHQPDGTDEKAAPSATATAAAPTAAQIDALPVVVLSSRALAQGGVLVCTGCVGRRDGGDSTAQASEAFDGGGRGGVGGCARVSQRMADDARSADELLVPLGFGCVELPLLPMDYEAASPVLVVAEAASATSMSDRSYTSSPGLLRQEAHQPSHAATNGDARREGAATVWPSQAPSQAGSCSEDGRVQPAYPAIELRPWAARTLVVATERRRGRWETCHGCPPDPSKGSTGAHSTGGRSAARPAAVTVVPAVLSSELPSALLDYAYATLVDGMKRPSTDREYAAHSAGVMMGHLSAWEVGSGMVGLRTLSAESADVTMMGAEGAWPGHAHVMVEAHAGAGTTGAGASGALPALGYITVLEDDASRTPAYGDPPLDDLVAELEAHDADWDLLVLNELPSTRLVDVAATAPRRREGEGEGGG